VRLVWVGEDPDSLPEPKLLNRLQTPYELVADPLPLLLRAVIQKWRNYNRYSYCLCDFAFYKARGCERHFFYEGGAGFQKGWEPML